jgi:hypothetical protein
LQRGLDTPQLEKRSDLPVGSKRDVRSSLAGHS